MMQPRTIGALRDQLTRVRNYGRFWEHYLDWFASSDTFQALGRPAEDEQVVEALSKAAGQRLHRTQVRILGLQAKEILPEGLLHGSCFLNGRFCTFLFSRDHRQGLMALASLTDGQIIYSRFSTGPRAAAAAA